MYGDLYRKRSRDNSRRAREAKNTDLDKKDSSEPEIEDYKTDILYRPKSFGRHPISGEENVVLTRAQARKAECEAGKQADKHRKEIDDDIAEIEMAIRRAGRQRVALNMALNLSRGGGQGGGGAGGFGGSRRPPGGNSGGIMGLKRKREEEHSSSSSEEEQDDGTQIQGENEGSEDGDKGGVVLEMEGAAEDASEEEAPSETIEREEAANDQVKGTEARSQRRSPDEEPSYELKYSCIRGT